MDLARCDSAPADRLQTRISQHARRGACGNNSFEGRLVARSLLRIELRTPEAPRHTPATAARPAFAEERLEITPPRWRQRVERQPHFAFGPCHGRLLLGGYGLKSLSTFAFTFSSILMRGGQVRLKPSPRSFLVASIPSLL